MSAFAVARQAARLRAERHRRPLSRLTRRWVADHGPVVQDGPFAGLRYPRSCLRLANDVVPKLVGAYESELVEAVEALIAARPRAILNVGAGEGYYAVGLARRLPEAAVVAFEIEPLLRRLNRDLARANGTQGRVKVEAEANPLILNHVLHVLAGPALVVCDCEGAERELLDPAAAPLLRDADLLVELHDFAAPGVTEELTARFTPTHDLRLVETEPRFPADWPLVAGWERADHVDRALALAEFRPAPMRWLVGGRRIA